MRLTYLIPLLALLGASPALGATNTTGFYNPNLNSNANTNEDKYDFAFPSARGFGRYAKTADADQVVYRINSLLDTVDPNDGLITLRECVEADQIILPYAIPANRPRYCLFDVSGDIQINSPLISRVAKLYIAGQSSLSGIQLSLGPNYGTGTPATGSYGQANDQVNALLQIESDDTIVRHLRFRYKDHLNRPGNNGTPLRTYKFPQRVVIDHVSASNGTDGVVDLFGCKFCTVQYSFIGPNLAFAGHIAGGGQSEEHMKTMLIKGAKGVTVVNNVIAYGNQRGINFTGGERNPTTGAAIPGTWGQGDYVNNVIYFYRLESGLVGNQTGSSFLNIVANRIWAGPRTITTGQGTNNYPLSIYNEEGLQANGFQIYIGASYVSGKANSTFRNTLVSLNTNNVGTVCGLTVSGTSVTPDCTTNTGLGVVLPDHCCLGGAGPIQYAADPTGVYNTYPGGLSISDNAGILANHVAARLNMKYGGAIYCRRSACRDAVDVAFIDDIRTCDANPKKFATAWPTTPATAFGTWTVANATNAVVDTDHDGMPDSWENTYGLNPLSAIDGPQDPDNDHMTNLDEYLNYLAFDDVIWDFAENGPNMGGGSTTDPLPAFNCGYAVAP